jgi:hypothetical protein
MEKLKIKIKFIKESKKKNDDQIWKKKDNWSNDEIENKLKFNKKTKNQNIEGQT